MDRSGIRSLAQTPEAKDLFRKELVRQAGLGKMWAGDLEIPLESRKQAQELESRMHDRRLGGQTKDVR